MTAESSRLGGLGGAVAELQRSRGPMTAERRPHDRVFPEWCRASTEPRSDDRGELIWKATATSMPKLQRSRGPMTAERRHPAGRRERLRRASTEPRSDDRGESATSPARSASWSRFNGAAVR